MNYYEPTCNRFIINAVVIAKMIGWENEYMIKSRYFIVYE